MKNFWLEQAERKKAEKKKEADKSKAKFLIQLKQAIANNYGGWKFGYGGWKPKKIKNKTNPDLKICDHYVIGVDPVVSYSKFKVDSIVIGDNGYVYADLSFQIEKPADHINLDIWVL